MFSSIKNRGNVFTGSCELVPVVMLGLWPRRASPSALFFYSYQCYNMKKNLLDVEMLPDTFNSGNGFSGRMSKGNV